MINELDFTHKSTLTIDLEKFAEDELKHIPDIKVDITLLAWLKMTLLVKHSAKEIAWHGIVTEVSPGHFVISDAFTYPQIVTAATVDADENQYSPWILGRIEQINHIRLQGHSHVSMGVTPSGTDVDYYKKLVNQVDDFYIFIIMNKASEYHIRVYDKRQNILFTDVRLGFVELDSAVWVREQMLMISEKTYGGATSTYNTPNTKTAAEVIAAVKQEQLNLKAAETAEDEYERMYDTYAYSGKLKGHYD